MTTKYIVLHICVILFTINSLAQAPQVIETSPIAQSMVATIYDPIIITFDQPVNEATITSSTFQVFGRWSGPMDGIYSFEAGSTKVKFTPMRNFFYGEWVKVGLSSGIENTAGNPLTNGYSFNYWTKALPASLDLVFAGQINMRMSGEGQITCYGAYAGDINNDELSDLVVVVEDSDDIRVLLNDGSNNYDPFVIIELPPVQGPSTNEGADFNHDGLIDIAIGSTYADQVNVLRGDASTFFGDQFDYQTGEGVRGLTVADFNGDGWDDIATANRFASTLTILMNDGTGEFEPAVTVETGLEGETAIAATDLNGDGSMDLLVAGYTSSRLTSLLNDGTGNFTIYDTSTSSSGPWMIAIGDVNGDGFVDVASANSLTHRISIFRTDGLGGLEFDADYNVDTFPVAIDLGDIDGDGDLDFISSNVLGPNYTLMENDGTGTFINPRTYSSPAGAACATIHDRNNDGAMDITMIDEANDVVLMYNNTLNLNISDPDLETGLALYPNPFQNKINVGGVITGSLKLFLYDVHGRLLYKQPMEGTNQFDLSELNLSEGMYFAEVYYRGYFQKFKIFKN